MFHLLVFHLFPYHKCVYRVGLGSDRRVCVFIMKTNQNTPLHVRTHVYLHVKVANVSQKKQ